MDNTVIYVKMKDIYFWQFQSEPKCQPIYDIKYFFGANYVILRGKHYVYRHILNNSSVSLNNFLLKLKVKLEIKETISINMSTQ